MAALSGLGDFEIAPKKGSNTRVELGLNLKESMASARIVAQKPGGTCQYAVSLGTADDVDSEVVTALRKAYAAAG